jgi:sucrose-6-phosphate hydrolase SacC (GH32 family)
MRSILLGLTSVLSALTIDKPDLKIVEFQGQTYGNWVATGTAFSRGPVRNSELMTVLEIQNSVGTDVISSEIDDDKPVGTLTSPEFRIERRFITFRIGGGDYVGKTCINLLIDGKAVESSTGHRSDRMTRDGWDVSRYRGKNAKIQIVDGATGDWGHINVNNLLQSDQSYKLPREPLYKEKLRPQFHFTARYWKDYRIEPVEHQEGWINDLNGLIYYDGEYHLFAQRWATCWLHAVSKDLIHWTELKPAFWEESLGSGVQSGTIVVDYKNTSGLGKDPKNPPMIAFWSRFDNRSQCLCYSLDHGRTWNRYKGNPYMIRPERDPKVFWYEPGKHWVMILYGDRQYHILNSTNLLEWTDTHHPIPDSFECPDFFELPIDGDKSRKKWVLIQGNGQYSIGTFDGKEFKQEGRRGICDYGSNFYATQSWSNTETGDGRRIQVAWMRGANFPDMPFSQMISFPCELTLRTTRLGLQVLREPIKEVAKLHGSKQSWKSKTLASGELLPMAKQGDLYRMVADVNIPARCGLTLSVGLNTVDFGPNWVASRTEEIYVAEGIKHIEVLIDRGSIEVFVNHGQVSITRFATPLGKEISLKATGNEVAVESLELFKLKSAWP